MPTYSRVLRRLENQRARAHGHILTPVHASGPDTRGPIGSGRGSRRHSSRCRLGVTAAAALRRGGRCRSARSRAAAAAALHREEAGEASDEVVDRTDRHRSSEVQIETRALRRPLIRIVQTRKVLERHRRVRKGQEHPQRDLILPMSYHANICLQHYRNRKRPNLNLCHYTNTSFQWTPPITKLL